MLKNTVFASGAAGRGGVVLSMNVAGITRVIR